MEASVHGIIIFAGTVITHGKTSHGGLWPIVRYVINYGIPGPAIGAVDKRVKVSPVLLVEEFSEAIAAGCCVWGYEGCSLFALCAGFDFEINIMSGREFLGVYLGDSCQGWGGSRKFLKKLLEGLLTPFYLYFNTLWRVGYIAV
jgi:hypothetical protein